jgi:alkane 1-monooxygenase
MILERLNLSTKTMLAVRSLAALMPLATILPVVDAMRWADRTGWYDAFAWMPLVMTFGWLTLLDYIVGRDTANPAVADQPSWVMRALPLVCAVAYLVTLAWALNIFLTAPFTWVGKLGWICSVGSLGGILAINVAHELIHKRSALEQGAGGVLLSAVCYGTFKVEHTLGHHAWVGTPQDGSTARIGETVYGFFLRALSHNPREAFVLQAARLKRAGRGFWSLRNETLWWTALSAAIAALAYAYGGVLGLSFFLAQALVAIAHLECVNYIEHYGLVRAPDASGRLPRVAPEHSWNSSYFLTNAYLFQLQRHSDHHANAARPYAQLQHHEGAPQLPGGYGAMMMLAMVPPLWRRVIHPRLPVL